MRRTALTALVALMVVLAGCGATSPGTPTTATSQTDGSTLEPTSGSYDGPTGTIAFYVSDQPAAIEDFEHLNVTITEIGLKPKATDGDDDGDGVETESEENETEIEENETDDDDENASSTTTTTVSEDVNDTNTSTSTTTTTTTTVNTTTTTNTSTTTEEPEAESDDDDADDEADEADADAKEGEGDDEKAGWVTYEVDNRTVDLTELRGANASRLADLKAPNGTYTTVFVYVSEVNGTLKNGESVNVKLPSQKLQLHTTFTIGPDSETEFVYDIAVHKAGNSGKYILKPNIAESGTEVEIDDIDEKGHEMEDDEEMDDDEMDADEMGDEQMDENASMEGMDEDHDENESEMDDHGMNESEEDMMDSADDEMENETADGEDMGESHGDDGPESETDLQVAVSGNITANESVTIEVTNADGSGVPGASVFVNDGEVGTTGADGTVSYTVPSDVEELEIEVTKGQHEGEFEVTVE